MLSFVLPGCEVRDLSMFLPISSGQSIRVSATLKFLLAGGLLEDLLGAVLPGIALFRGWDTCSLKFFWGLDHNQVIGHF